MKTFFTLLLLTNIAFAVVQWLLPYDQLIKPSNPLKTAERLKLLDEPESQSAETVEVEQRENTVAAATPLKVIEKMCFTLGPFKEKPVAQAVMGQFKQNQLEINSRPSVEKEYMGMMVYIDGYATRKEALKLAAELDAKGMRDHIIFNEPDKGNALSLGVFSLKKNADRRYERVQKLGYAVKTEPRYRSRTIYWLDYSEAENETLSRYINDLKAEQGISRISRPCQ